jgi:hypothetical protein
MNSLPTVRRFGLSRASSIRSGNDLSGRSCSIGHEQVETQLLAFVRRLERNYSDWHAVHLHLSGLKPHNRRDYQLRIAAREFDRLMRKFKSELFQVSNGDIFLIWHGGTVADVDPVVLRLRYLFSDDPLNQRQ